MGVVVCEMVVAGVIVLLSVCGPLTVSSLEQKWRVKSTAAEQRRVSGLTFYGPQWSSLPDDLERPLGDQQSL